MSLELPEGRIDFVGQKLVNDIVRIALIVITAVSFIAGFALQSIQVTFGIYAVATVVVSLVVLPPWPMFNKHPVQFLAAKSAEKKKS